MKGYISNLFNGLLALIMVVNIPVYYTVIAQNNTTATNSSYHNNSQSHFYEKYNNPFIITLSQEIVKGSKPDYPMTSYKNTYKKKSVVNLDMNPLYLTGSYARKITKNLFLGIGVGGGFGYNYNFVWNDWIFEYISLKLLVVYIPISYFQMEAGSQASLNGWGGDNGNEPLFGGVYGIYIQPLVGLKNLKIGFKLEYGTIEFKYNDVLYITPIIIRLNFLR